MSNAYTFKSFFSGFLLLIVVLLFSNYIGASSLKGVESFSFNPSLEVLSFRSKDLSSKLCFHSLNDNNKVQRKNPSFHAFKNKRNDIWTRPRRDSVLFSEKKASSVVKTLNPNPTFSLFNTATRTKIPFSAIKEREKEVTFYSCGPTVYDMAHIGNFRAFLTYDVLKRWLMVLGYDVQHICNLTDIDDKIIQRMQRDQISLKDLTNKYADIFQSDLSALNILPANSYPRATEYIPEMIEMISELVNKGHAYKSNGSVYFRVQAFERYGELAKLDKDGQKEGAGEGGGINDANTIGEQDKENKRDFVLWKAYKKEDGEAKWDSPFGPGRPGWHIECSAMARSFLGQTIDLHGGGIDLLFPHHENEKAQSEAANDGAPFCNCWIHNGFVNINNEKMSKSKNNFLTLSSTLPTALHKRAFRFLIVSSMYRQGLNFTQQSLDAAVKNIKRLDKAKKCLEENIQYLKEIAASSEGKISPAEEKMNEGNNEDNISEELLKLKDNFIIAMNDDLNTPRAAASLFSLIKVIEKTQKEVKSMDLSILVDNEAESKSDRTSQTENQQKISRLLQKLEEMHDLLVFMDKVFGIYYQVPIEPGKEEHEESKEESKTISFDDLAEEIQILITNRNEAKASKDWTKADACRDELKDTHGLLIKDIKGGAFEIQKV